MSLLPTDIQLKPRMETLGSAHHLATEGNVLPRTNSAGRIAAGEILASRTSTITDVHLWNRLVLPRLAYLFQSYLLWDGFILHLLDLLHELVNLELLLLLQVLLQLCLLMLELRWKTGRPVHWQGKNVEGGWNEMKDERRERSKRICMVSHKITIRWPLWRNTLVFPKCSLHVECGEKQEATLSIWTDLWLNLPEKKNSIKSFGNHSHLLWHLTNTKKGCGSAFKVERQCDGWHKWLPITGKWCKLMYRKWLEREKQPFPLC